MRRVWLGLGVVACIAAWTPRADAIEYFSPPVDLGPGANWTNYIRFADLDGDLDPDVVVPNCGGFFANPSAQPFRIFRNDGGTFVDATLASLGVNPTLAVRVVAIGDIEGDGDLDLFLASADGTLDRLMVNDGSGAFTDQTSLRLPANTASRSAAARFGDVDGDGDLDLLVTQGYATSDIPYARLYDNDGSGVFTLTAGQIPTSGGTDPDDIDFVDIDRDFDLDVLINAHVGPSSLWRNDGSGTFTDVSSQLPAPATNNFHYNPSACDVDGDDDLDIWIDNIGGSFREQLLRNGGTGTFSDVTTMQVSGNPSADDNGVVCIDIDDDGDFDAAIPSLSGNERILINDGAGTFALVSGNGFPSQIDPTLWIDFADVNGDGRLDAVTGQGEGNPEDNRIYLGNGSQPLDGTAPRIIASEAPPPTVEKDSVLPLRFAVSDRVVTDGGPRLFRAYARVTDGSGATEIPARFVGGDLFWVGVEATGAVGSSMTVELCATDRRMNDACGAPLMFDVVMASGTGGGGGAGGGGGSMATTTTTSAGVGGAASSSTGSGGATTTSAASGGNPVDPPVGDSGGCSCRHAGRDANATAAWWLLGLALLARRRR